MSKQWLVKSVALLTFAGAATLPLSAQAVRGGALPGTVNYVEGQVSINGNPVNPRQTGAQVQLNQSLMTANGRAEMLLSPGVFVRAGNNTEIRMVSPGLIDPTIEVVHGQAMIEVDQKLNDARITVLERGASASILKYGLYRFDSDSGRIAVFDGQINVTENGMSKKLGKGREVMINGQPLKSVSFDVKAQDQDPLYRWSSVRSGYLAEANMSTAQYVYAGYNPYWTAGWAWNPYFSAWSWLPGDGFFYSPFGYPFFSPGYVVYAGRYGYGRGFGGAYVARGFAARSAGVSMAARGGFGGGGFHGGGGGHR
jgi:hypothetical protein